MNKQQKEAEYKRIAKTAEEMEAVAKQLGNIAARLKSEANSALNELGVQAGRARKGCELSQEELLSLKASLTMGSKKQP